MLILKANRELTPSEMCLLADALRDCVEGTEFDRFLLLDGGLRAFQCLDGVWREIGEPVEDAQVFLAQRSDLGVCRELVTRAVARLQQLGDHALAAQIADQFRVPAADLDRNDVNELLIDCASKLTIYGAYSLAAELLERHGLLPEVVP